MAFLPATEFAGDRGSGRGGRGHTTHRTHRLKAADSPWVYLNSHPEASMEMRMLFI